jgi:hypothetical protein
VNGKTASNRSLGRVPEEGLVVMGDDSSMLVIAPEDLSVGQDVEVENSDSDDLDSVLAAMCFCLLVFNKEF